MFYLTGDTHGDFRRVKRFCREQNLTAEDTVIVLGDAGINYFENDRDKQTKKLIAKLPVTVFCIHGNHEVRPQNLSAYRESIFYGGTVFVEDEFPNILFAKDGEVFEFDGLRVFVIGGAYSVDKHQRLERGWSWFPDEQPDDETKELVERNLSAIGWKTDIVLTHTCPQRYEPTEAFLSCVDQSSVDKSTEAWLDEIEQRLDYRRWFCGHFHISKRIDKMQFMFEDWDILHQ